MAQLVVLYKTPTDTAAFDAYYANTHIALAKKIPGLRNYEISHGTIVSPAPTGVYLVATLTFDSLAAIQSGLGSAEGQAAAGDVGNFATGGAEMLMFDTREV